MGSKIKPLAMQYVWKDIRITFPTFFIQAIVICDTQSKSQLSCHVFLNNMHQVLDANYT